MLADVRTAAQSHTKFFIGGQWVRPSSDREFIIVNPSTEEVIGTVPEAVEADIDRAVAAARHAFEESDWSRTSASERADVMNRFIAAIGKREEQLSRAVSMQNGMLHSLSKAGEVQGAMAICSYFAQLIANETFEETRPCIYGGKGLVRRTPIGVVAGVVPWNVPVLTSIMKLAPALATGCTMVLKPSPGTVLDNYILAEAAEEAGVPPGVLNCVAADRDVGAYLVSHPGVNKVSFTGSTMAGRAIARACGELLRPVTLELGGKSAAIILEDADLDLFMASLPGVSFYNGGQACILNSRILAPASRYNQIVDAIASFATSMKVGDPFDPSSQMGPLVSEAHRLRVEGYIAKGKDEARLVAGGGRPRNLNRGWFVEPTVFADVSPSAVIAQEEIFGPVLAIFKYEDEDQAVRIANDSIYGLHGSVWSRDTDHAIAIARQIKTGGVGVNGCFPLIGSPFGGVKASGLGRENCPETLTSYQQWQTISIM